MAISEGSDWFRAEMARKETIRRCRLLAQDLYQKDSILSHERIAWDLRRFLAARYEGDEALLSVIEFEADIAGYLSCGDRAIQHALAVLLRLAQAFADHPDYRSEWSPETVVHPG